MSKSKVPGTAVCGKCGGERDGANTCYCKACFRDYQREWRAKTGRAKPYVARPAVAPGMRRCPRCGEEKAPSLDNFHAAKRAVGGLSCWCKPCFRAHKKSKRVPKVRVVRQRPRPEWARPVRPPKPAPPPPPPRPTASDRFWAMVETNGPVPEHLPALGQCWMWEGNAAVGGYGQFWFQGRNHGAHRFAWSLQNGPIPPGAQINHHCDTKRCVRVDHLFLGTQLDNMRDKVAKQRQARGERDGNAKLTAPEVLEIRRLYAAGVGQFALARQFRMSQPQISTILRGRAWCHLLPGRLDAEPQGLVDSNLGSPPKRAQG